MGTIGEDPAKKKDLNEKESTGDMGFLDHLEELRWRIFKVLISITLFAASSFFFSDFFVNFLIEPTKTIDPPLILQVLRVQGMLIVKMWIAFFGGVILSLPVIFQTGAPVFATPIISGDDIYVGNIGGAFYSIDSKTGTANWKYESGASYYSTPSVGEDNVFIMSGDGILISLSRSEGNIVWKGDLHAPISEGMLLSGRYIYVGSLDGNLYAVSAETGRVLWSEKLDGRVRTSPLEYKGSIFIGTENKYLYAFEQDGDE